MSSETGSSGVRPAHAAGDPVTARARQLQALIDEQNARLLNQHPYFILCRSGQIDRRQALELVKQLYCFSVYFERLLARRVTEHSSLKDPTVLALARKHLSEEIGHAELFRECLITNGLSASEVDQLTPSAFTKAMFGYLTVTIQYESEYVSNVAIMQVMESIGHHFFEATLSMLESHGIVAHAIALHAAADVEHAQLGADLLANVAPELMGDCRRVVYDIYQLMSFVLAEWLGVDTSLMLSESRRALAG